MAIIDAAARFLRRRNARVTPEPGQIWQRGAEVVFIDRADGDVVTYRTETGEQRTQTLDEFRGRFLGRVRVEVVEGDADYLGHVWALASMREVAAVERVIALGRALQRAPDAEARDTVRRWMQSLSSGVEPQR